MPKLLVAPKPSLWIPSQEITGPIPATHRYGECLHTKAHARLYASANKLLAAVGFFPKGEDYEDVLPEAESIGIYGLRPTWHGKA